MGSDFQNFEDVDVIADVLSW